MDLLRADNGSRYDRDSLMQVFGKSAMPVSEDPAFQQPCLAACTTAQAAQKTALPDKPCHKLQ